MNPSEVARTGAERSERPNGSMVRHSFFLFFDTNTRCKFKTYEIERYARFFFLMNYRYVRKLIWLLLLKPNAHQNGQHRRFIFESIVTYPGTRRNSRFELLLSLYRNVRIALIRFGNISSGNLFGVTGDSTKEWVFHFFNTCNNVVRLKTYNIFTKE